MSHGTDNEREAVQMYETLSAMKERVDFMVNQLIREITSRRQHLPTTCFT